MNTLKIRGQHLSVLVNHEFGGNGFIVVQPVTLSYSRVVFAGKGELGTQAFLAHHDLLREDNPIPPATTARITPELKPAVDALCADLAAGRKRVVGSHIVAG
jgi:hypothetical protein